MSQKMHQVVTHGAIYCTEHALSYDARIKIEAAIEEAITRAVNEISHGMFMGSISIENAVDAASSTGD